MTVSILAHPEGWALFRQIIYRGRYGEVSILAHPEGWALYPRNPRKILTLLSFNPRPPRRMGAMRKSIKQVRIC